MHPLLEKQLAAGPVVTDGAWGTQLQERGLGSGEFPDQWNLTHPDKVGEVAAAYVQAGSQVILANTFGANRPRLAAHHLEAKAVEINRAGVQISKQAAGGKALVFASIGPSGKMLLAGEVTADELTAAFSEQAQALAAAGADALVVETMADLEEAKLAVVAAKLTGLPVVACMVFDSGKNKDRTMTGVTPEQAVAGLSAVGADVIGANCGQGIEGFVPICQRMRAVTTQPLWMKSNAGLPEMENGRVVYRTTPEAFAAVIPQLVAAGANFVGGCCGTSPAYIRAVVKTLGRG
ncbi:MAG: homocysteine S-methyltransferase family protein [Verrucomicrobia bacterium]|nr:homocysteine S-methyltransferase family protein [Verrucomicrobiota bacterium]